MKKFLVLLVMAFALCLSGCDSMCTDAPKAKQVLAQQGYSQVTTTGYAWLGCGKDDWYRTGFLATAPNGSRVSGIVCEVLFKGATVRFD